jgi:phosphate transport system substrate-binding protein
MFRLFFILSMIMVVAGCQPLNSSSSSNSGKIAVQSVRLQGAGASFPAPLYLKWFKKFSEANPGIQVDYQSVGSGSGVKSFLDETVDFGASDAAMSNEEIERSPNGARLIPLTAGAIVLAYNIPNVDNLQLSRAVYAGIFTGTITNWNDPQVAQCNPGVSLPDLKIHPIMRADSSGTSYVFSMHLSAINSEFAKAVGVNKMPSWQCGTKSKGNEGVTASIATTPGSIGYIEYSYARGGKLKTAKLENQAGKMVAASTESCQSALQSAEFDDNLIAWVPDPASEAAYPIVTYTWVLLPARPKDEVKHQALIDLVQYCLTEGQKESESLGYVPLPAAVVQLSLSQLTPTSAAVTQN